MKKGPEILVPLFECLQPHLAEQFATVDPLVEEPLVEEPLVEEPLVEEPLVDEPLVEEPEVDEPLVDEPLPLFPEPLPLLSPLAWALVIVINTGVA